MTDVLSNLTSIHEHQSSNLPRNIETVGIEDPRDDQTSSRLPREPIDARSRPKSTKNVSAAKHKSKGSSSIASTSSAKTTPRNLGTVFSDVAISQRASMLYPRLFEYTAKQQEAFKRIHTFLVKECPGRKLPNKKVKRACMDAMCLIDPEIPKSVLANVVTQKNFKTFMDILKKREIPVIVKAPADKRKNKRTSIDEMNDLYLNWKSRNYLPFSIQVQLRSGRAVWNVARLNSDRKVVKECLRVRSENKSDITRSPYVYGPMIIPEYEELAKKLSSKQNRKTSQSPTQKNKPQNKRRKKTERLGPMPMSFTKASRYHQPTEKNMHNFFSWRPPKPVVPYEPKYQTLTKEESWKYHQDLRKKALQCKATFYENLRQYVATFNKDFSLLRMNEMGEKQRKRFQILVETYSPTNPKSYIPLAKELHEDEGFSC